MPLLRPYTSEWWVATAIFTAITLFITLWMYGWI